MKIIAISILFFVSFCSMAFSAGETFKIETTGTEYCGDFLFSNFSAGNNVDFWIREQSEDEILVSFTPDFKHGTTFFIHMTYFMASKNKTAFVGEVFFEDDSWLSIFGKSTLDKNGMAKSIQGTFIQNGVIRPACFSSGTFKKVK